MSTLTFDVRTFNVQRWSSFWALSLEAQPANVKHRGLNVER